MRKILILVCITLALPSCKYKRMFDIQSKFGSTLNKQRDSVFVEEFAKNPFIPPADNETTRLYYLCKVWGFAKYYHNNNTRTVVNVDSVLFKAIPQVLSCSNKIKFNDLLLNEVIDTIQYTPLTEQNPHPDINQYTLIDNKWFGDSVYLNSQVQKRLDKLFLNYSGWKKERATSFVYNRGNEGTVRQSNEKAYENFNNENIRLLGLFRYWNMINYFYPYKNSMDESWDQALYESIPLFRRATSKEAYHKAIYQLTNRLRDTHASYPATVDGVVFGKYRPNFRMMNVNDTLVINRIRDKESYVDDFKVGDIVLEVGGMDAMLLYDSLQAYVCGSTHWSNVSFACNAVLSRQDSTTQFTILRGQDTLRLQSTNSTAWDLSQKRVLREKANEKNVLYKWMNDSVAYFDLTSATYRNFKRNYKPIRHARTIILDLRCYPDNHLIMRLADAFVPQKSLFAYVTYADTDFPGMLRTHRSSNYVGHKDYYKGNVFVLVNEWTQSYSEYLTMLLQANPNTITVGRSSSGSDGNVSMLTFPGGVKALYSGIGIYYPGMIPTQRVGVKIDYVVEPSVISIKNKRDLILQKAIKLATKTN